MISGGVDSAVAVHRLVEQGHDVSLFYIRIASDDGRGDCSAEEDLEMCRLIASRYGLPLDTVDLNKEYWESVMEYALRTVRQGLTPNPDIMCNRFIKFGYFEERRGYEFDYTATGHYARTLTDPADGLVYLATAPDPVKDQTDFLARISYRQLSHAMFPIGDLPKAEVRRMAVELNLPNARRRDSQGICFLGKINYNDFIRRHLGERPGPVVEIETGRKIGGHKGYWFHTIGQRKGLGLSGGPWYVVRKNVRDNVVYVSNGYGTGKQYGRTIHLQEMHWISADPFEEDSLGMRCGDGIRIAFKNRHSPQFIQADMVPVPGGGYVIESESDVQGIAPGQYAVVYTPDTALCLGSGMISSEPPRQRKHKKANSENLSICDTDSM